MKHITLVVIADDTASASEVSLQLADLALRAGAKITIRGHAVPLPAGEADMTDVHLTVFSSQRGEGTPSDADMQTLLAFYNRTHEQN